jgi:flagellar basal-body rod modification protein FlgD
MSTVTGVNSTARAATDTKADASTASRIPQKALGQQDFLTLLATQFQMQDPMKPMEDTAFIAQMAQFSALEQSSASNTALKSLLADQKIATANSYLGHHVTLDAGNGEVTQGDVSAVEMTSDGPRLVVGDLSFPLSAVLLVEPRQASTPAPITDDGA